MIAWIVRHVVERAYRDLNAGNLDAILRVFAADAVFEFHGDTPFGGERRGRQAIRGWFEEVWRDFGRLELSVRDLAVSGPPWNMRVIVRFGDRYHLSSGDTLDNYGFQYLRLSWGRVKEDRILVDHGILRRALDLGSGVRS